METDSATNRHVTQRGITLGHAELQWLDQPLLCSHAPHQRGPYPR